MTLKLMGSTSGYVTIDAPAVAGTTGITLPAISGGSFIVSDSSGNVGIGTSSPGRLLSLYATQPVFQITNVASGSAAGNGTIQYQVSGSTDFVLDNQGSGTGGVIRWMQAGSERMRIDSSGNLLVGTTSSPSNARFRAYGNASADFNFGPQTASGNNAFIVYNQSNVGVYLVSGNTSWTATSDERKKDIIEPITDAANKVSNIRAVIGKYKTDEEGTRRSFLIAQDIQSVLPEAVDATDPDNLGVSYTDVIPLLVAAITELKAELDALKAKVGA